ncbi:hypothetical protein GCM10010112_54530 [Actinoplanes lobatus]|uniref:Pyrrolo-quinoline quinone repeat domain-containing protein n=1 Tax=Actinoplanes lobatus TaxID=113568 RepID=A0A7W7MGH9_9ACTN|nr:PQQ-binding-like beta-propeller repeat protein [Actinoplanes lobatus]MBB4749328.1 hypothetical protein [Actinoplanes lobatus]GGN79661.1 hypothetical protein GCM10010112_54530 [Actinoplanes lobatus]GIE40267.1 hypothetical protein Alo02nite_31650 [Actinoplanes lobatus]
MIIDLDVPGPPPDPVRRPRHRSRGLPVLLSAVLLFLLGASTVPSSDLAPRLVADLGAGNLTWLLTDRMIYSVTGRPGEDVFDVTARPVDGEVLWTRPLGGVGMIPVLHEFGPHLAVEFPEERMLLLDARTGEIRRADFGARVAGDRILLRQNGRIGLLDPVTARPVWWRWVDGWPLAVTGGDGQVRVVNLGGTGAVYDRDTGATVRTAANLSVQGAVYTTAVSGDWMFLFTGDSMTVVRMHDLKRLWTARLTGPAAAEPCGDAFCVTGATGVTAVNQRTGSIIWTNLRWRAWSGGFATGEDGRLVRLDPGTGAVQADLGQARPAGTMLVREGGVVTDAATGRLRGVLDISVPSRCASTATHLACQDDETTRIWRLP